MSDGATPHLSSCFAWLCLDELAPYPLRNVEYANATWFLEAHVQRNVLSVASHAMELT